MRHNKQATSPLPILGLVIWSLGALFFLYEFFLRTFIGSIAQQVIADLRLNAETFSIIGSSYYFVYSLMQVPVGVFVDKFGVKKIMVFATLICAGATFLFAHSVGFTAALISRLLMGFGSSFAFICLLVISVTWFPRRYFGFFAGVSQFVGTMGPLLAGGPLIAWMANYHESWQTALSEIAGFGVVLSILILFIVRSKPRENESTLIYLQITKPLKKRLEKLVKNPQAWWVASYSASTYLSIALLGAIWGTEYLQVKGLSQSIAADMVSLLWLGYAVGCPLLGALSDIMKRRKPVLVFCSTLGFLATFSIVYLPIATWIYGLLFFSLGMAGSGQNVGFAAISEHVDLRTRATALGLNNGLITLSAAIFPLIVSYFINLSAGGNAQRLVPEDFMLGFSLMPVVYALSAFIALFLVKETYCKPQKEAVVLKT